MSFGDNVITVEENPGAFSIFLVGEPGCGKTILSCRAPRPLLLDAENSRKSLKNHPELRQTPILPVGGFEDVEKVVKAIVSKDSFFDNIDTIIIDTIDSLQRKITKEELKDAVAKSSNRHPYLPSQAEFNITNRKVERLVSAFLDQTDKNLILNVHVKEEQDDEGRTVLTRPGTTAGLTYMLISLVDGIFYMSADTDSKGVMTTKIQYMPQRKYQAKNRFGNLPRSEENPDFSSILSAYEA